MILSVINLCYATNAQIIIDSYEVEVGSTVDVSIVILNAQEIAGGSVKIYFSNYKSLIVIVEVDTGDFSMPAANINNSEGFVHLAASLPRAVGKTNATLAVLKCNGTNIGDAYLCIEWAELNDEQGNLITPDVTGNGKVHVIPEFEAAALLLALLFLATLAAIISRALRC